MRLLGLGAAAGAAAQLIVLVPGSQGLIAAAAVFVAFWQLWAVRRYLNQHVDMILLMAGYGGAAMLPFSSSCHSSFWTMSGVMLVVGLPPVWFGARCVLNSPHPVRLLTLDSIAMLVGMGIPHLLLPSHASMLLGMLAGMASTQYVITRLSRPETPPASASPF